MKKIITLLFIFSSYFAFCGKIEKAYQALSIFDYFKARQLFYSSLQKNRCEASYGLAVIYSRNDNPFSNIDSACKFIKEASHHFKDTASFGKFHINHSEIKALADVIARKGFLKYGHQNNTDSLNYFLKHFYFASDSLREICWRSRDLMELNRHKAWKSSDSMSLYLQKYPESFYYQMAKQLYYDFQYHEQVPNNDLKELKSFLISYAKNPNTQLAEKKLFDLILQSHSADSIYAFIKKYSSIQTRETAWKALYSESVKVYSSETLHAFSAKYPDYPYSDILNEEITLANKKLIPLKNNNQKFGFIDTLGNWIINPIYDEAFQFSEGYAVVYSGDSCFFINKNGQKAFESFYDEASQYQHGITIIKKGKNFYLQNKAGQIISKGYDDISASENGIYICQMNTAFGAINAKGEIIIPFTYKKLGRFKNGYSYYSTGSSFGLLDLMNDAMKAQWDWVSDVDTNLVITIKKNQQFGLMNIHEEILLDPSYDFIAHCSHDIYLIVKNQKYGFYSVHEKCFITSIDYDYSPSNDIRSYTDGNYFIIRKDNETALIGVNGKILIPFKTYDQITINSKAIKVQKNNKTGFLDKKLKPLTPVDFETAEDFTYNNCVAAKNQTAIIINLLGKSLFSLKGGEIERIAENYFITTQNNLTGLISINGDLLLKNEYTSIKSIEHDLFICNKNNQLFLFNSKTKALKEISH